MNRPQRPFPDGKLGRAGVAIAAEEEGQRLVAAWETIQGTCGPPMGEPCPPPDPPGLTGFGFSTDGGRTWTDAGGPFLADGAMTGGHPWLERGGFDNRTFFLVNRARGVVEQSPIRGLVVHRGRFKDDAFAWTDARVLKSANPNDIWRSPSLAAAKDGSGKVFLAFSSLREVCGIRAASVGQIHLFRSADEGASWEGPVLVGPDDTAVTLDPKDPRCGNTGAFQFATNVALGPAREVYVLWQFGPMMTNARPQQVASTFSVRIARSLDEGRTFNAPRDVVTANAMWHNPPVGFSKDNVNNYPRLAVATEGPHRGRVYVTYVSALTPVAAAPATEQRLVSSQAYLVFSDDQGSTWSAPVPLGPPLPPAGVKRLWPTVAIEPGGEVSVVYLESQERQATADPGDVECTTKLLSNLTRTGKASSLVDLYWVRSTDGGATFGPPVRVTSETSNWCKSAYDTAGNLFSNYGDYLGLYPARGGLFTVWTDGRSGVPDAYVSSLQGSAGAARAGEGPR